MEIVLPQKSFRKAKKPTNRQQVVEIVREPKAKPNRSTKNKKRRTRQKANKLSNGGSVQRSNQSPWHRYFKASESATLEKSVHQMLQTQFFPDLGVFRGQAGGYTPTSLARNTFVVDLAPTDAVNTISFAVIPQGFASGLTFASSFENVAFSAPFSLGSSTYSNAAWNTTYPGGRARCVSCELKVIPEGSDLNQSGAGIAWYDSDQSTQGLIAESSTKAYLDDLTTKLDVSGKEAFVIHWTPNEEDARFNVINANALVNTTEAACIGFYLSGVLAGSAFRIEIDTVIEFEPNSTLQTYVLTESACIHPDTTYWTSMVAGRHFKPLLVSTVVEYDKAFNEVAQDMWLGSSIAGGAQGAAVGAKSRQPLVVRDKATPSIDIGESFVDQVVSYGSNAVSNPLVTEIATKLAMAFL